MLDYLYLKEILVTSEITALEHELRDDTVETAAGVSLHQRTFQTPIRIHFDQYTTHGSSWQSWEQHHRTVYYPLILFEKR
jgi:hypothetical protein